MTSPAKLLNEAKNAAGDLAVAAAKREDFTNAREWQAVAAEIDRVFRDAIAALTSRASNSQKEPSDA